MAAVLAGLKSVDFYRKLKRDLQQELTEVRAVCLHALSGSRTFGVVCVCVCVFPVRGHSRRRAGLLHGRRSFGMCRAFHDFPRHRRVQVCVHIWLYTWRKGDLDHVSGGSEPVACTCAVLTVAAAWHSAYMSVTTESKVILDHFDSGADDSLQVCSLRLLRAHECRLSRLEFPVPFWHTALF